MKRTRQNRNKREGFTLIEMLVVLGILVLLLSMVGPSILNSAKKADINSAKSQIGMIQLSLDHYKLDMRSSPQTEEGLMALVEKPSESENKSKWSGPYITKGKIPKDPWGNEYQYEYPPSHGKEADAPDVWSLGPDGEDNTEDDIVSWVKEDDEEEVEDEI